MTAPYAWTLLEQDCTGCGICMDVCDFSAIAMSREMAIPAPVPDACTGCMACEEQCPFGAIKVQPS